MATTSYGTSSRTTGQSLRVLLTLIGAAGIIIGSFMRWTEGFDGTTLDVHAFWMTGFHTTAVFVQSAGFVMIVLGLVAVIGSALGSGWLTRLAGAVAIVGLILFGIEVFRSVAQNVQLGVWIVLVGAVLTLIAGFFGSQPVVAPTSQVVVDE